MIIFPAVDISGGKCVRLYQGRVEEKTVYSDDPVEMARRWIGQGASYLHSVDLDGAFSGTPKNLAIAGRICQLGVPVQLGGGMRTEEHVAAAFEAGCWRVILGTRAIIEPAWFEYMASRHPGRLAVSIDAREEIVALKGWVEASSLLIDDVVKRLEPFAPSAFIYTAISRDGTLEGADIPRVKRVMHLTKVPLIVAGGISSLGDVSALAATGVHGAIIGKALYSGSVPLPAALKLASDRAAG